MNERRGARLRILIAVGVAALMLALSATGATANQTFSTKLSIEANRTQLKRGGDVTISGTLSSKDKSCRRRQTVSLFGTGKTDRTNWSGRYKFRLSVAKTTTFRVVFAGSTSGTSPDAVTCQKSKSSAVTVVVSHGAHRKGRLRARRA